MQRVALITCVRNLNLSGAVLTPARSGHASKACQQAKELATQHAVALKQRRTNLAAGGTVELQRVRAQVREQETPELPRTELEAIQSSETGRHASPANYTGSLAWPLRCPRNLQPNLLEPPLQMLAPITPPLPQEPTSAREDIADRLLASSSQHQTQDCSLEPRSPREHSPLRKTDTVRTHFTSGTCRLFTAARRNARLLEAGGPALMRGAKTLRENIASSTHVASLNLHPRPLQDADLPPRRSLTAPPWRRHAQTALPRAPSSLPSSSGAMSSTMPSASRPSTMPSTSATSVSTTVPVTTPSPACSAYAIHTGRPNRTIRTPCSLSLRD